VKKERLPWKPPSYAATRKRSPPSPATPRRWPGNSPRRWV